MNFRTLISYILLSALILLLLSTAAQAAEYKAENTEIQAGDILNHIEKGDDIYLENCRIIGELNTSKIKLKTVLNPEYDEVLNNGFSPEEIILYGIKKNLSVVESNITIKDSIFEDGLNFSYTIINGSVDFSGSKFNAQVNFSNSYFEDSSYFFESDFNDSIDLSKAVFDTPFCPEDFLNISADFTGSTFNGFTDLSGSYFNSYAGFGGSTFNGFTDLSGAFFNGSAYFGESTFNAPIRFRLWPPEEESITGATITWFNDSAYFSGSTFNAPFCCEGSAFCQSAFFGGSTFNNYTRISACFFADSCFSDVTFNAPVDFNESTFDETPEFSNLTFNYCVNFSDTDFNFTGGLNGPEKFKEVITNNERVCNLFREYYQSEARYDDADDIYYTYRKFTQDSKKLTSSSKWIDILVWITCGYGVKPLRILYSGVFIVGIFTLSYWQGRGIYRASDVEKKPKVSVWDALYFSTSTFTTLGSADWYPTDSFRKWVTLEGLLGWVMLGIFMATLTNVTIRV